MWNATPLLLVALACQASAYTVSTSPGYTTTTTTSNSPGVSPSSPGVSPSSPGVSPSSPGVSPSSPGSNYVTTTPADDLCPAIFDPVCASNGRFYGSPCRASKDNAAVVYRGNLANTQYCARLVTPIVSTTPSPVAACAEVSGIKDPICVLKAGAVQSIQYQNPCYAMAAGFNATKGDRYFKGNCNAVCDAKCNPRTGSDMFSNRYKESYTQVCCDPGVEHINTCYAACLGVPQPLINKCSPGLCTGLRAINLLKNTPCPQGAPTARCLVGNQCAGKAIRCSVRAAPACVEGIYCGKFFRFSYLTNFCGAYIIDTLSGSLQSNCSLVTPVTPTVTSSPAKSPSPSNSPASTGTSPSAAKSPSPGNSPASTGTSPSTAKSPSPGNSPSGAYYPMTGTSPSAAKSPSPSNSPSPSDSPSPAKSPSPGNSPSGAYYPMTGTSPSAAKSPSPSNSPSPSDSPSPAKSPSPGNSPSPSDSPSPGKSPSPGNSPSPSDSPSPGNSPGGAYYLSTGTSPSPGDSPSPGNSPNGVSSPSAGTSPSPDDSTCVDVGETCTLDNTSGERIKCCSSAKCAPNADVPSDVFGICVDN